MLTVKQIQTATLAPQSYGVAMAQGRVGKPAGVWLECTNCPVNHVIVGSNSDDWCRAKDSVVALVFRRHGWTGESDKMLKARCPKCSNHI